MHKHKTTDKQKLHGNHVSYDTFFLKKQLGIP